MDTRALLATKAAAALLWAGAARTRPLWVGSLLCAAADAGAREAEAEVAATEAAHAMAVAAAAGDGWAGRARARAMAKEVNALLRWARKRETKRGAAHKSGKGPTISTSTLLLPLPVTRLRHL
jgi:hypothetical protein